MRRFDYKKYKTYRWDNEILNYLSQIYEYKGKQELFLRQKPVEMEKLVDVAKVQSIESSKRICYRSSQGFFASGLQACRNRFRSGNLPE